MRWKDLDVLEPGDIRKAWKKPQPERITLEGAQAAPASTHVPTARCPRIKARHATVALATLRKSGQRRKKLSGSARPRDRVSFRAPLPPASGCRSRRDGRSGNGGLQRRLLGALARSIGPQVDLGCRATALAPRGRHGCSRSCTSGCATWSVWLAHMNRNISVARIRQVLAGHASRKRCVKVCASSCPVCGERQSRRLEAVARACPVLVCPVVKAEPAALAANEPRAAGRVRNVPRIARISFSGIAGKANHCGAGRSKFSLGYGKAVAEPLLVANARAKAKGGHASCRGTMSTVAVKQGQESCDLRSHGEKTRSLVPISKLVDKCSTR